VSYYNEAIIKHIMTHINEGSEEYKKFFASALKKFGVKSPTELDDGKKREFFNYVDKNWKAKDEVKESDFSAKVDAYQKGLEALDSYVSTLEKLGLKKKAKVALKALKMIQRSFFAKEQCSVEDAEETNESASLKAEDPESFSAYKTFMDTAFKKAGIRVRKFKEMKRGYSRAVFAAFYHVKSASGNDVLPVYIDKRGNIELGVSAQGFELGRLNQFSTVVKRLKDFKASDLDEVNERKIYEVGSPLNSYLSHALNDVGHLLDVAKDKEHGPDAYESWKKSAKLLVAATKLLRKVK
jgi:ferritin-like protein